MSFFYGYEEEKNIDGLSIKGGEMKGDINMNDNHIITSVDPSQNSHLTRKKYTDDNFLFVDKTKQHWGNQMDELKGNIRTNNFQIYTKRSPNDGYSLVNKAYVDSKCNKRLSKTGGTMTGNIDIGNYKILSSKDPTDDRHLTRKKYVDDKINSSKLRCVAKLLHSKLGNAGTQNLKNPRNFKLPDDYILLSLAVTVASRPLVNANDIQIKVGRTATERNPNKVSTLLTRDMINNGGISCLLVAKINNCPWMFISHTGNESNVTVDVWISYLTAI